MTNFGFTLFNENSLSNHPSIVRISEKFCKDHDDIANKLKSQKHLEGREVTIIPATTIGNSVFILFSDTGVDIIYQAQLAQIFEAQMFEVSRICNESGNHLTITLNPFPTPSEFSLEINENA